jgi:hypothetical protein
MDSVLMAINILGPSIEKEKLFSALFQKLFHCVALSVAANGLSVEARKQECLEPYL